MAVAYAGRRVLITGGASGIGAACARRFARDGATVTIADLDCVRGKQLANEVPGVTFVEADVASAEGWSALHSASAELDVLVFNAFRIERAPVDELDLAGWQRQLDVNLTQLYLGARHYLPTLRAHHGSIVAVSSVHALAGLPGYPAYAATKSGMCGFVRQLAVEYGGRLRVNAVLPGPILTEQWGGRPPEAFVAAARATALGRMGTADEVAAVVSFLCSEDSSFITGASILVDGGWSVAKDSP